MTGQDGHRGSAVVTAVAVALAGTLLAAVGVAALRGDTARADTVLARGADVVLELADGSSRPGVEGETVPRGATVRAGVTGARLDTRGREVWLGADTAVTVVDGARQVLHDGFVVVDASDAPGVAVDAAGATVTAADDSLVRVDDASLLRVGVLRGDAASVRPAARSVQTPVPTYFQVQVPARGLPSRITPFELTGDEYERDLAAELVAADADLTALAQRLDSGRAGRAVLAALAADVPAADVPAAGVAVAAPGSERALGFLLATAAPSSQPLAERYADVRELRADGGSWGVVAAIVGAPVDAVSRALTALLEPGTVPVLAAQPLDLDAALGLDGATEPDRDAPVAPGEQDGPSSPPRPPRPAPTPTPAPTPSPGQPVVDTVEEVVDDVLDLVSPSPSTAPLLDVPLLDAPLDAVPLPLPLPTSLLDVGVSLGQ